MSALKELKVHYRKELPGIATNWEGKLRFCDLSLRRFDSHVPGVRRGGRRELRKKPVLIPIGKRSVAMTSI